MPEKQTDKENSEAEVTSSSPASAPKDPVGACFYIDAEGQNRCLVTTESMCRQMQNSEFHPGKNCPDF